MGLKATNREQCWNKEELKNNQLAVQEPKRATRLALPALGAISEDIRKSLGLPTDAELREADQSRSRPADDWDLIDAKHLDFEAKPFVGRMRGYPYAFYIHQINFGGKLRWNASPCNPFMPGSPGEEELMIWDNLGSPLFEGKQNWRDAQKYEDSAKKRDKSHHILSEILKSTEKEGEKEKVLDLACGVGLIPELCRDNNYDFTCVDASTAMLKHLKGKTLKNVGELEEYRYPGRLPFREGTFSRVVCNGLFPYVVSLEPFVVEAKRVLKKGGLAHFSFIPSRNDSRLYIPTSNGVLKSDYFRTPKGYPRLPHAAPAELRLREAARAEGSIEVKTAQGTARLRMAWNTPKVKEMLVTAGFTIQDEREHFVHRDCSSDIQYGIPTRYCFLTAQLTA